ncbi:MAG TPA: hypothetical protein VD993_11320 [Chitinophagaceae bacterium]|nr:hypothetical protein [Chitinophagaceae bacterium]
MNSSIPTRTSDLVIGSLSAWNEGLADENQRGLGDLSYFSIPMLLEAQNLTIYSPSSDLSLGEIKQLRGMLENIYAARVAAGDFNPGNSEFSLHFVRNELGHIELMIKYHSWEHNGALEFTEKIDQSYLPTIIGQLDTLIRLSPQF